MPLKAQEPNQTTVRSEEESLTQQELGELMKQLLVDLPEQQRMAVTLRHLERLEYPQIAEIMDVAESTVRTHVHAGREALRQMIVRRYPEWTP